MEGNTLGDNIALGKRAWMIEPPCETQYPASDAVDGDRVGLGAAPNYGAIGPWLAVDLEESMAILRTVVYTNDGRFAVRS